MKNTRSTSLRLSRKARQARSRIKKTLRRHRLEKLESRQLLAVVTGEVFQDLNADSIRDDGEGPIAEVRVYVDADDNSVFDETELSALTNADGRFRIEDIPAGDHVLRVVDSELSQTVTLTENQELAGIQFGIPSPNEPITEGAIEGRVWFDANASGVRELNEEVFAGVEVYIDANNNAQFDAGETSATTSESGTYAFTGLTPGDYIVRQQIPSGFYQSAPQVYLGTAYPANSDRTQLFQMSASGDVQTIGNPTETQIYGLVMTNSGTLYGISHVTDSIYTVNPLTGRETRVARLGIQVGAGLAYDAANDQIYAVGRSEEVASAFQLLAFDPETNTVTPVGEPLGGLANISDLTFDSVQRRVVGFDNVNDQFFSFDELGSGELLGRTSAQLNSFSLAFNGRTFVMLDQESDSKQDVLIVNPDTGRITPGITASRPVPAESLFFARSGPLAQRLTVGSQQTVSADFGLASVTPGFTIAQSDARTVVSPTVRTDSVTVVLNTRPTEDVVIGITTDPNRLTLSVDQVVFTTENWNVPQTVSVNLNDGAALGDVIIEFSILDEVSDAQWSEVPSDVVTAKIETESRGDEIVINEVYVGTFPYLELRGPKNGVVPEGTYFVVADEYWFRHGEVNQVFDLGGLSFGSNGFMVFVTNGATYAIHPDSSVYRSQTNSFAGLPEDIHTSDEDFWDTLGGKAYMLIQSDVAPLLTDNIDVDEDGFIDPDGVAANWNVVDSISMQNRFSSTDHAYGDIVFREEGGDINIVTKPGVPIVLIEDVAYAGRIGDSVGSDADDWIAGPTQNSGTALEIVSGNQGPPSIVAFQGLPLDHLGESNFVGGVRGAIFESPPSGDGPSRDAIPASGLTVFADMNDNGVLDVIRHVVEPDELVIRDANNQTVDSMELLHAVPGVSISMHYSFDSFDDDIRSESQYDFPNYLVNRVFTDGGTDWFNESRRLRFDFFDPVSAVSIDVIGNDSRSSATYGRLDAFNADGEFIGFVRSRRLVGSARQTISLSAPNEDISYVLAYSEPYLGGSSFGRFDRFTFDQLEPHAVTDEQGEYEIKHLFPGVYDLTVSTANSVTPLVGADPREIEVTRYENFEFIDDVRANSAPTIDREAIIELAEDHPTETVFETITARDVDTQSVRYSIVPTEPIRDIDGNVLDPETEFPVLIDELTGELQFAASANLDFEAQSTLRFNVLATDPLGASSASRVTIRLTDINEAPVVRDNPLRIRELAEVGEQVGRIEAFDPDIAMNQTLSFLVTGGTAADWLAVDPATGNVTVKPGANFDFETPLDLTLELEVRDSADPAAVTTLTKPIQVIDENDAPLLSTQSITIEENQTGRIERLVVEDADRDQAHLFEIIAGNGIDTFKVSRDGVLSIREGVVLDFESQSEYQIDIRIIDTGTPPKSTVQTLTINVSDVDEAPTLDNRSASVPEDASVGSLITQLSVFDPEGAQDEFKLEMLESEFASHFEFDEVTGELTLAEDAQLDFESNARGEIVFEVKRTNGESIGVQSTLVVTILDRNEAPLISTESIAVSESVKAGEQVGRVRASDPDHDDTLSFAIVGGTAEDLFVIDPQLGLVRVAPEATLDAETDPERTLEVEVTDRQGLSTRRVIRIGVNDVNEAPVFTGTLDLPTAYSGQYFEYQLPAGFVNDPEGGEVSLAVYGANKSLPSWLRFDPTTRTISGTPNPSLIGATSLTLRAFEPGLIDLFNTFSFSIDVERGEKPWMKQRNPLDVDDNGMVTPGDAIRIINFINANPSGALPSDAVDVFAGFVDVSGDNLVTPLDAVLVINGLMAPSQRPQGEQIASIDNSINERERNNDTALEELLREESKLF